MGFTETCVINKNTPELKEKLNQIGRIHTPFIPELNEGVIIAYHNSNHYVTYPKENYEDLIKAHFYNIGCGTNEELFLAVAARRDDSDYKQYFVNKNTGEFKQFNPEYSPKNSSAFKFFREDVWHKATVEELIEYFK